MTEIMFLLACSLAASAENVPTPITLWTSGSGFPCYRQPVIVAAASPSSRLLAFVEGRFSSPCGPAAAAEVQQPREVGGLNLRVSEDGGASWGLNKVIFGNATTQGPNMDYFSVVVDQKSKTIHLLLQVLVPRELQGIQHFSSTDQGESWHRPVPLGLKGPTAPTVGHGIQLSTGALLVPAVCPGPISCSMLSIDGGKTWKLGGAGSSGSRESSATEVPCAHGGGGDSIAAAGVCIYFNARNMHKNETKNGHPRLEAVSTDSGLTWGPMTPSTALFTPVTPHWTGIVANIVALPSSSSMVYAGASNPAARARMALSVSTTSGMCAVPHCVYSISKSISLAVFWVKIILCTYLAVAAGRSWSRAKVVWPGPAGYADIVAINRTHVGILYEAGDKSFADRVQFSVVPVGWLST